MWNGEHVSSTTPWEGHVPADQSSTSLNHYQSWSGENVHPSSASVDLPDWQQQQFGYGNNQQQYDLYGNSRLASSSDGSAQNDYYPVEQSTHRQHSNFNPFEVHQQSLSGNNVEYPPGFSPPSNTHWSGGAFTDPSQHQDYVVAPEWDHMFSHDGVADGLGNHNAHQQHHQQYDQGYHHNGQKAHHQTPEVIDLTDSPTSSPPPPPRGSSQALPTSLPQGFLDLASQMPALLPSLYEEYQSMFTDMTLRQAQSDIHYGADTTTGPFVLYGNPTDKVTAAVHIQSTAHYERSRRHVVID